MGDQIENPVLDKTVWIFGLGYIELQLYQLKIREPNQ